MNMNPVKSKQIISYAVIALVLVIGFILLNSHVFAGTPPTNIGINNARLTACPATPNCVNSQVSANENQEIVPIQLPENTPEPISKLKQVVELMPRVKIIKETPNYLYVEFSSKLMGFVDDVEFYLEDNDSKTIQVRSASRLGDSDWGVNRQRIEEIRTSLMN